MSVLNLVDLHNTEAGVYLFSVMCNSRGGDDEHRRFIDAVLNHAVSNVLRRNDGKKPINPEAMDLVANAAVGPRLADIARDQALVLFTRGFHHRGAMAGMLLTFILAYAEHDPANVSKQNAYKMFEKASSDARLPDRSRATLVKVFDDFEPVAHFWAATVMAPQIWGERANSGAHLARFLGFAEALRRKAIVVQLDQGPALDPAKTWTVPDRFVLPAWDIQIPTPNSLADAMTHWPRT
jgi:hypothetical protein